MVVFFFCGGGPHVGFYFCYVLKSFVGCVVFINFLGFVVVRIFAGQLKNRQ